MTISDIHLELEKEQEAVVRIYHRRPHGRVSEQYLSLIHI